MFCSSFAANISEIGSTYQHECQLVSLFYGCVFFVASRTQVLLRTFCWSLLTGTMEGQFGVALFGLGRAGSIHIENLRKNYRCRLLYVVELEVNRALEMVERQHMKETRVIEPKDAEEVYHDPE